MLVFSISVVQFARINIGGVLSGGDIAMALTFVALFFTGNIRIRSKLTWKALILGSIWLASQIVTDIWRHSRFADYARGWSNIGLTLFSFCVVSTLIYGKPRRIVLFGWGQVISGIFGFLFFRDVLAIQYPWKFGLCAPVTLAVVLLASRKNIRPETRIALMSGIGFVNLLFGARNASGCCLSVAIYLLLTRRLRERAARGLKLSRKLKVAVSALLLFGFIGIYSLYGYMADNGYLGEDSKTKYEEQSSGEYGLLVGGRAVLLSSIVAIIDSPILGHGSWAKDPAYIIAGRSALSMMGYKGALKMAPEELVDGYIPAHSFLLGAWVYAGVCGAFFWAWVWVTLVKSLIRIYPPGAVLLPLMAYFVFLLLWDILFSPFGLDRRNQVPYYLIMIFTYYEMAAPKVVRVTVNKAKKALRPALNAGD